jgi:hypothetical protein
VGVFDSSAQAREAIAELKRMGFRDEQIGVAARDMEGWAEKYKSAGGTYLEEGAGLGAAVGAGAAAAWSLAISFGVIPVIGPVLAAGPIAAALISAAGGAAAGGLVGGLIGLGVPEDEAAYYDEHFKAGRTLVTVQADGRHEQAASALRRYGSRDGSDAATMGRQAVGAGTATSGTQTDPRRTC